MSALLNRFCSIVPRLSNSHQIIKKNDDTYRTILDDRIIASYTSDEITEYPDDYWRMTDIHAVCGDVDGNGQAETLITFNGSAFLIGDEFKEYNVIKSIPYPKVGDTKYKLLKIAAGDLDNNGTDEFVVAESSLESNRAFGSAVYHLYGGITMKELAGGTITTTSGTDTVTLHAANCAVRDLDADGLNEVVFVGGPEDSSRYNILVLDSSWNDKDQRFEYAFIPKTASMNARSSTHLTPICAVVDLDGTGKPQLPAYRYLYENLSQTGSFEQRKNLDLYAPEKVRSLGSAWDCSLAVGNVDETPGDEISFVTDSFYEVYTLGYDKSGAWVRRGTGNIVDTGANFPYLTMGDYDGDSITVEFTGSETLLSAPHPIAVPASNPYFEGIDMAGETGFGTSTEHSNRHSIGHRRWADR